MSNYLFTQRSNRYLKLTYPKLKLCFILLSSQKSAPLTLLPSSVSGNAMLPKSRGHLAALLSCASSDPSAYLVDTTSTVVQPPWSRIKVTAIASCSSTLVPMPSLISLPISAQLWWTAPFTLLVFPLQAHFGVLVTSLLKTFQWPLTVFWIKSKLVCVPCFP